ncbi:hypothetical protein [Aeromicrobium sp. P5_D10]
MDLLKTISYPAGLRRSEVAQRTCGPENDGFDKGLTILLSQDACVVEACANSSYLRLESNRNDADKRLAIGAQALDAALQMTAVPEKIYEQTPDNVRREINSAFFERLFVDEHGDIVDSELVLAVRFIVDTYRSPENAKRPDRVGEASASDLATNHPLPFLRDLFWNRGSNTDALVKARETYSSQTTDEDKIRGSNTASFVELRGSLADDERWRLRRGPYAVLVGPTRFTRLFYK